MVPIATKLVYEGRSGKKFPQNVKNVTSLTIVNSADDSGRENR